MTTFLTCIHVQGYDRNLMVLLALLIWVPCESQVMENMQNLINLQELWLGRNRIKVVNLCGLKCIKKISLQSNRLTSMKGFEVCCDIYFLVLQVKC